jgi:hypothetical protein
MADRPAISVIISSRAQKEMAESWAWYEDRLAGLGDRFPTRFKSYKEAPVPTFPFLLIYRISKKSNLIRVVSVFHTSRNPKKKYR